MKKFTKIISLTLALILALAILPSCGKEEGTPTLVWYMRSPVADMSQQAKVEAAANAIIEPAIGAKLRFEFIDAAAWTQKKNMMISTGEEFDLIFENGAEFVANAQKGAYLDLRPYLTDEYIPEILKRNDQFVWDAVTFGDGGVYAIPAETFYVPYTSFAFKADTVDKYNFDYANVKTYADLVPLLEKVKNNEKGMYGLVDLPELQSTKYISTTNESIVFDIANDKFIAEIDSPDKISFWKTVKDFVEKGYMPKDAATKEAASEIKSGKYAVFGGQMSADKSTSRHGFRCYENEPQFGYISRNGVTNALTCISATSKNPEKALALLNLIWEDRELSNLLAFGIEGEDFVVTKNAGQDDRFVDANNGSDVKWAIWHNWLGPLWDQWDSDWNSAESLLMRKEINASSEKSPIIGFLPDTSAFETELALISSTRTEWDKQFKYGSINDFDGKYAEMKKKYEEAGLYKLVDEFNKQYKEWKK